MLIHQSLSDFTQTIWMLNPQLPGLALRANFGQGRPLVFDRKSQEDRKKLNMFFNLAVKNQKFSIMGGVSPRPLRSRQPCPPLQEAETIRDNAKCFFFKPAMDESLLSIVLDSTRQMKIEIQNFLFVTTHTLIRNRKGEKLHLSTV